MSERTAAEYDKDGALILSGTTRNALEALGPRTVEDYRAFKTEFVKWLAQRGKEPVRRKGYADTTVKNTSVKIDQVFRWRWDDYGGYTQELSPNDADRFIKHADWDVDYADGTIAVFVRALKRFFRYQNDIYSREIEWDCELKLSQSPENVRDYFRKDEFQKLYEAALTHGTVKHYNSCSKEERQEIKNHLAFRLGVKAENVTRKHFMQANSWKIPSLMAVTLDVGLRPIEVKRSTVSWFDPVPKKPEMDIPAAESTKNENNWRPALSPRTVRAVELWLKERETMEKYQDTDAVWLTKYGNPYHVNSLNTVLDRLLNETDIDPKGRSLSWYSIRHGVATVWANEVGIHHAKEQMRHNSVETTMGYVHSSSDNRAEHLRGFW